MKIWKIFPGICLAVLITWGLTPAAWGAPLVTSDTQVIQLGASSPVGDTTGILSFSKLMQLKPDGTQLAFVLPIDKLLVITYININVRIVDTYLATNAELRMGPFYSRAMPLSNGFASYSDVFDPGIVISPRGFGNNLYNNFYAINLQNNQVISGSGTVVNVRLIGYLASAQ